MRRFRTLCPLALAFVVLVAAGASAQSQPTSPAPNPVVVMTTSLGEIQVRLLRDKAPVSVENFLAYVNKKFYDGTIFHRVIPGFMIQGGGFTPDMTKKPTAAPIKIESQNGLKNMRGAVAMARTNDPNSGTSQFFINVVDNPGLDYPKPDGHGYAVFGQVISGIEVVDRIKSVPTGSRGGMENVPASPVIIESIRLK